MGWEETRGDGLDQLSSSAVFLGGGSGGEYRAGLRGIAVVAAHDQWTIGQV